MKSFKLIGLETEIDWQLAYESSKHVEGNKRVVLTYGTPEGDVTMSVKEMNGNIQIRKLKNTDKNGNPVR